jgi:hypothetical protein
MTSDSRGENADAEQWLTGFIQRAHGVAGTVHWLAGDVLVLRAAVNIPAKVQEITRTIPKGKGMAGLAWERALPVQTCNLKTDDTGDVRPGAKAVNARGAIAIPLNDAQGAFVGVVGVAFADERELDVDAVAALTRDAVTLLAD